MKKLGLLLVSMLLALSLASCSNKTEEVTTPDDGGNIKMEELSLEFVPSKDADVIIASTENLDELLIEALAKYGYDVEKIDIQVGTSYDATAQAMDAGSVDLGWLPGGTYALHSEGTDVILTATRNGLSNDSTDPKMWNGLENATQKDGPQVAYYRSLIYAGPSAYGQELAAKVNAGEELTWDDLNKANWEVRKSSSSAGYIYPTMWLMDNYDGKKITDLDNVTVAEGGYGELFGQAAAEQIDIFVCYADGRNDYEASWQLPVDQTDETGKAGLGGENTIWEDCNVIGVTEPIYNDTVAITKANPDVYNPEFIAAAQNALIDIINSEEGKKIFSIYSHTGYQKATDADYDGARKALDAIRD